MKQTFSVLVLAGIVWATPSLADPGRGATVLCYLWADQPSPPLNTPYTPSPIYSFNAQDRAGGISVTKVETGTYVRSPAPAWAATAPGGPAGTCRSRLMGMASTLSATLGAGARAAQISPPRSTALAEVVVEVEAPRPRTVSSICCSSGSTRPGSWPRSGDPSGASGGALLPRQGFPE